MAKIEIHYQTAVDQAVADIKQVNTAIGDTSTVSKKAGMSLTDIKSGIDLATGALRAMAEVGKQAFEFGKDGAAVTQTAESFDRLLETVGANRDLLAQLREASSGTISDMTLMSATTTLLAGTQGDLATSLANATPELLEIAKAANKLNPSLGDTAFLYESIATGVKRASPLILDNLGLTIKIGEANETYAEQLGKTVEQLTADEQKQALLNATLEAGAVLIEQAGGAAGSATDEFARMEAELANFTDTLKAGLAPAIADSFEYMFSWTQMWRALGTAVVENDNYFSNWIERWLDLGGSIAEATTELVQYTTVLLGNSDGMSDSERAAILYSHALRENATPAVEEATEAVDEASGGLDVYAQWLAEISTEHIPVTRDRQGELNQKYSDLSTILSGTLGDANAEFALSQAEIRDRSREVLEELEKLRAKHGQVVTVVTDTDEAQRNLTIAMYNAQTAGEKLAEAQEKLTEDPGDLGLQAAVARAQGAFNNAQGAVGEWNDALAESSGTYVTDFSEGIGDLEGELGDLTTAYAANKLAHQEMVQGIVFDMLTQRLAADGWTEGELGMLAEVGLAWGIYDEDTATALGNVDAALIASQGEADEFLGYMNRVMGLPDKEINVLVNYKYNGYAPGDPNDPTNYLPPPGEEPQYQENAAGGNYGGGPMLVGEQGPELMFPQSGGYVMNNANSNRLIEALEAIAGGGMGGINMTFNGGQQSANQALATQLRRVIQSGGWTMGT